MRKTYLIQLTIVALLLLGINSQAVNATVFVGPTTETIKGYPTPVINTVTEPEKQFKSVPSLDGAFVGTYANFSDGDPAADRLNNGTLLTASSECLFTYPEIVGPAVGIFVVELLEWNDTIAPDIDLYPGYVNSTMDNVKGGFPENVTDFYSDYYGSGNPEFYYLEVNITEGDSITLTSYVMGYVNSEINFTVSAAWINYDEYFDSIGYFDDPVLSITKPVDGGHYAVSDLLADPQRYVALNYSYVPGIEQAWSPTLYEFAISDWDATADGGTWMINVVLNGVDSGQLGGSGEKKMGLTEVGEYVITVTGTYDGRLMTTATTTFTVEEPTVGEVVPIVEDADGYTIRTEFIPVPVPAPMDDTDISQVTTGIDSVTLNYFDQGTDNVWHEAIMVDTGDNFFEYTITDLYDSTVIFYWYTVTDELGMEADITSNVPYWYDDYEQWVNTTVETSDDGDSPALLAPLAIISIGLMAIVRRRK